MRTAVLDIGGTAMKSGIYENGKLYDIRERPTEAKAGGKHVISLAKTVLEKYKKEYSFEKIGISTAGQVNPVKGSIIFANENIPGYTGMEIKKILEQEFGVATAVENDVNAAAMGEAAFGAGKGYEDFACLTYGTGVGGAVFTGGKLYSGSSFSAGEFGGIVTHPECRDAGKDMFSGCYERYASTTALVERAREMDAALVNGRLIFGRIEEESVKKVIDGWIMEIVYGLITVVHMLNPSCIILGGGVMEQPYVLEEVRKRLYENIMPSFRHVDIKKAELGNSAGMLGAAVAAGALEE